MPKKKVPENLSLARPVELLECGPSRARRQNGPRKVLISVEQFGQIENLAFTLDDARRLVRDTLLALSAHGDATARHLVDRWLSPIDNQPDESPEKWWHRLTTRSTLS
jgi:hypothetical protein